MPAGRPGCRRRRRRSRSGRAAPARRSCRGRPRRRAARRRPASSVRRTTRRPSARASASASSKRSGLRGAITSSAVGCARRTAANAASTGASSPFSVLAAMNTGRAGGRGNSAARGRRRGRRRRPALERVELQAAGDDHARRIGADVDDAPRRLLALHAEAIDVGEHACGRTPRASRYRGYDRAEIRPLTSIVFTPCAPAGAQQVRPDLGLHHDEEPRPHQPQRPVDERRQVEREEEHAVHVLAGASARSAARSGWSSTGRRAGPGSARAGRATRARAVRASPTDTA